MASLAEAESFENTTYFSRILRVTNVLGISFTAVRSVVDCVYRFVTGINRAEVPVDGVMNEREESNVVCLERFSAFIDNMDFMYPDLLSGKDSFSVFNEYCIAEGLSYSAVFVSEREICRFCGGNLATMASGKEVIVYHLTRGTYLGSRFAKHCRKCKVQEHYGFYNHNGKRIFDKDCLEKEFLLSTEETAIDINLLRYLDKEIVHGALPFQVKAKVYNSVHGYSNRKVEEVDCNEHDTDDRPSDAKKRRYEYEIPLECFKICQYSTDSIMQLHDLT